MKTCCFCCILFACFCIVSWFWFNLRFCAFKLFSWKKNEMVWNCPDKLIYYTTDVHPARPTYQVFIYAQLFLLVTIRVNLFFFMRTLFYPWESLLFYGHSSFSWELFFICENLCLYENKLVYESHHLKQIFYHQNMIMIFCSFRMFPLYAFCLFCQFFSFHVWLFSC